PISDVDVCGPARPEEVCTLCEGTPVRAHLRAAHFGTVELHIADAEGAHFMAEYTTFREDSYRCGHKPDAVRFTTDINVDAFRRDFSVNALYHRITTRGLEPLIDPTGGLGHLRAGVLHTVTSDPNQVLKDDGLRVLRAVRFQAELDLRPTPALLASMCTHAPLLADIACERLRDELQKVLLADERYPMLKRRKPATASGLRTLRSIGAWPLLFDGFAWQEDTVRAMENVPGLPARLALLLWQSSRAVKSEAQVLNDAEVVSAALHKLHFSNRDTEATALIANVIALAAQGTLSRFEAAQAGAQACVGAADVLSSLARTNPARHGEAATRARALRDWILLPSTPRSLRELAVNGSDIASLCERYGRKPHEIGETLTALWRAVLEGGVPNEREALLCEAVEQLQRP
ncbi:MAG: hypothetical protein RR065_01090, partial [Clostridia bacterium]